MRDFIATQLRIVQETANAVAEIDVLCSYATAAIKNNYTKPEIAIDGVINIKNGRHPVVELMQTDEVFVPNDTYLDLSDNRMSVITGPNMSGKSTYMRQTALIVLMAQAGCFVPADAAHIGVVDRIFTRIGASDNLAGGQSTFFVEMRELAYILQNATDRSLIILDEIGRGTSTYDGLSIAWAVVQYLCDPARRIRTMFASHYHELTSMEQHGLTNLTVDVAEEKGSVVFLHKIKEASASRSYGIQVAKLAGVPGEVLKVAQEKLDKLEEASEEMTSDGHQISMF